MSFMLKCNIQNCCKKISDIAWVTTCAHLFCDEHGKVLKNNWNFTKCPACGKKFLSANSICEIRTNASNEHKTMVLYGLNPGTILEIAKNAISFWIYQCNMEINMLEKKANYYKSKLAYTVQLLENDRTVHEQKISKANQKLDEANKKIEKLTQELNEKRSKLQKNSSHKSSSPFFNCSFNFSD